MTKMQAIRKYCLECAGDSAKEVTMCHILDCPLWQFRTGNLIRSKVYKKRIEQSTQKYPEEWKEIEALGYPRKSFLDPCNAGVSGLSANATRKMN